MQSNIKILIIEDEELIAQSIALCMKDEGYECDVAPTGDLGLEMALKTQYDALILDLMLPGINGFTLLSKLREHRFTPVLILTALGAVNDKIHGLDLGADDYLTKPFHIVELKARIRSILRRKSASNESIYFDDICVDLIKNQILLNDQPVLVTVKEYFVFKHLAINKGCIVSKDCLLDLFFSESEDRESNVLEVYISNLRKKIGSKTIKTYRGKGYSIP